MEKLDGGRVDGEMPAEIVGPAVHGVVDGEEPAAVVEVGGVTVALLPVLDVVGEGLVQGVVGEVGLQPVT
jgi:hypothetical protein